MTSTQEMRQGFTTNAPQLLQQVSDIAAMTIHEKEARRLGLASTHTTNTDPGASKQNNKFFMLERLYGDNKPLGGMGEVNNGEGGEPMTTGVTTTATATAATANATDNINTTTTSPTKKTSRSPVKKPPPAVVTKAPISALAKQIRALFAEQERAQGLGLGMKQGPGLDFGLGLVQGQGLGLGSAQAQGSGQESQKNSLFPSNILMPSSNGRILADMMCVNPSKSGNLLQSNATAAQSNIRLAQSNASMAQSNNRQSSSLPYLPSIHPPQGNNKIVGGSGDINNTGDTRDTNNNPTRGATTTKGKIDSGSGLGVGIYDSRYGKGGQQGPLHRKWGLGYNTHGHGLGKSSQPRNNNNNNDDDDDDDNVDEVSGYLS